MSLQRTMLDTQPIPAFGVGSLLQQWWREVQFQIRMFVKTAAALQNATSPDDIMQCVAQMEICRYEVEAVPYPPSFLTGRFYLLDALVGQVKAYSACLYDDVDAAAHHRKMAHFQMTRFEAEAAKAHLTVELPVF